MIAPAQHPVRLVAPWFRWQRQRDEDQGGGPGPRDTRPVFLKYASPELVNEFIEDPQRNYRFMEEDHVSVFLRSPFPGPIRGRADRSPVRLGLRKLYRDTHKRAYLVACELHCDAPGLPDAGWDHICERGFVVRRWVPPEGGGSIPGIDLALAYLNAIKAPIDWELSTDPEKGPRPVTLDPTHPKAPPEIHALHERIRGLPLALRSLVVEDVRDRLIQLRTDAELPGPGWTLQYWRKHEKERHRGAWMPLASQPTDTLVEGELTYPLYPLIPDPTQPDHNARGARLLFGVVPTSDMDKDAAGEPHLGYSDPRQRDIYEIRCFVRQHVARCGRKPRERDCPGPIRWSRPTEPYRIATHFDPQGTKNTSVRIEMPDLRAIAADPMGDFSIRMQFPEASKLELTPAFPPTAPGLGGPMICTTSIPLVTIVATVLLEIVTPIIVYIFQLYYLLFCKFCFPSLPALPPGLDALPMYDAKSVRDGLEEEYSDEEINRLEAKLKSIGPGSDADRLVLEEVVEVRPRVDDPALVEVTV